MGSYVPLNSLGHIATRWKPEEIPFSSQIVPMGVSVAEGHRQLSTMPHIYIATRPTPFWGSSRNSNLQTHAWEPGIATTWPPMIPHLNQVKLKNYP